MRIYFPPDANSLLSVSEHCLASHGYINVIIAPKNPTPQWLDMDAAKTHCALGASVWPWASNDEFGDPEVVLAAAGDVPTEEALAAIQLLRTATPELRVRFANVVDLFALAAPEDHPHGLDATAFEAMFTVDRPVVFAYHGYPRMIHELLHHRPAPERFHVRGYEEEGTTSTPFDVVVRNRASRYHLAIEALRRATERGPFSLQSTHVAHAIAQFEEQLARHRAYIREHDVDLPEITSWSWTLG